jgi:hypothetical protein
VDRHKRRKLAGLLTVLGADAASTPVQTEQQAAVVQMSSHFSTTSRDMRESPPRVPMAVPARSRIAPIASALYRAAD